MLHSKIASPGYFCEKTDRQLSLKRPECFSQHTFCNETASFLLVPATVLTLLVFHLQLPSSLADLIPSYDARKTRHHLPVRPRSRWGSCAASLPTPHFSASAIRQSLTDQEELVRCKRAPPQRVLGSSGRTTRDTLRT